MSFSVGHFSSLPTSPVNASTTWFSGVLGRKNEAEGSFAVATAAFQLLNPNRTKCFSGMRVAWQNRRKPMSWEPGDTNIMHREKHHVNTYEGYPKVNVSKSFVHHTSEEFAEPMVDTCQHSKE
jgi:hypothetical protein